MIPNSAGIEANAYQCTDGLWRMGVLMRNIPIHAFYPREPDGFLTRQQCEAWWKETGERLTCKVCGAGFFAAREDGLFCRPACRAKYNRHAQGASERAGTGAYYQRPEEDRTHKRQKDTFEYQCEWCGKTCTARAEAQRSGARRPKYCNDNGGVCRQAAYRAAKRPKSSDSKGAGHSHRAGGQGIPYGDTRRQGNPTGSNPKNTQPDHEPCHTGRWISTGEASDWLISALCWDKKIPRPAWNLSGNQRELFKWARRYLADNHPDRTKKPVGRFYKTVSDCYSYLRNRR